MRKLPVGVVEFALKCAGFVLVSVAAFQANPHLIAGLAVTGVACLAAAYLP